MSSFLYARGIDTLEQASNTDVVAYLMELKNSGKSRATANRKLSSIRTFYKYLIKQGLISVNPTEDIKSPKIERKKLEYLTIEEVEELLTAPDDSIKGIRDRSHAGGSLRHGSSVTEIIELKMKDVNLRMGFITCNGDHGRARIVPMGTMARKALDNYILNSRNFLMKDQDHESPDSALFVNYVGEPFSRQGFWKVLKQYGRKVGLESKITPHILLHFFRRTYGAEWGRPQIPAGTHGSRGHHGHTDLSFRDKKSHQRRLRQNPSEAVFEGKVREKS